MMTRQQRQNSPPTSQSGFTIIESLVAIIVVTILLVGVSPIIALSVAARVQSKRVERGSEAMKAYIEGVRAGSIDITDDKFVPTAKPTTPLDLASTPAPSSGTLTCNKGGDFCTTPDTVYCVDLDKTAGCQSTSPNDLVVQGFRTDGNPTRGFSLGVRVYRASAFQGSEELKRSQDGKRETQGAFSGTLGNAKAPIVETTLDIPPTGTLKDSFSTWCDRLQPSPSPSPGTTYSECR